MKFLVEGKYSVVDGTLSLLAEHEAHRYPVIIDREFFEERFGATPSGDFHEYWDAVLQNREELEHIAANRMSTDGIAPGQPISIRSGDRTANT